MNNIRNRPELAASNKSSRKECNKVRDELIEVPDHEIQQIQELVGAGRLRTGRLLLLPLPS
jgi:hypothetical protein